MQTLNHQFINNQWVASKGTRLLDVMNLIAKSVLLRSPQGMRQMWMLLLKLPSRLNLNGGRWVGPNVPATSMDC